MSTSRIQIHEFSDASIWTYGCCLYIRSSETNTVVSLSHSWQCLFLNKFQNNTVLDKNASILFDNFRIQYSRWDSGVAYPSFLAALTDITSRRSDLKSILLSTDYFLLPFKRFTARRGLPREVYCDCHLRSQPSSQRISTIVRQAVESYAASIQFSSIAPWAPHFGGLWKADVKQVSFQFLGAQLRIDGSNACRMLSSDSNDGQVLTPAHLLVGVTSRIRKQRNTKEQKFWKRYRMLSDLNQTFRRGKAKWTSETRNQKLGQVVINGKDGQNVCLLLLVIYIFILYLIINEFNIYKKKFNILLRLYPFKNV